MRVRFEELDSLRGLAALSVFFGHMYLMFNLFPFSYSLFKFGPFRIFIAGSEAVTLFFVLSGFVLALPFLNNKKMNYGIYVIRRISRIYIPYIIVFFLAILAKKIFYNGKIDNFSDWFNDSWSANLSFEVIRNHLILIDTFSSNINNVVWSLVHEMRISFIFPLLMAILIKFSNKVGILLGIMLSVISVMYCSFVKPTFYGTELYVTIHYCAIFIIGALLAKNRENLVREIKSMGIKKKGFLFFLGIFLYLYAHPSFAINFLFENFNPYYRTIIDTWVTTMGASIIIILAISSNFFSRVLKFKVINHIGKISYSLYLSHLTVLISCVRFFNNTLPMWTILFIVVILTFIVANILYYLVEKPSIKLGIFLTKSISLKENGKKKSVLKVS